MTMNWATFWPAFFATLPATIAALGALYKTYKLEQNTNSNFAKLLNVTYSDGAAGRPQNINNTPTVQAAAVGAAQPNQFAATFPPAQKDKQP
jgi:hypothetical protein